MNTKAKDLILLFACYLASFGVSFALMLFMKDVDLVITFLVGTLVSTLLIYLFGLLLKTPSVYDPYWSLYPLFVICILPVFTPIVDKVGYIIFLVVIIIYSLRLTINFCIGFTSFSYVDYRYKMLKEKSGKFFQLVNLFGICYFPTMMVYICLMPMIYFVSSGSLFQIQGMVGIAFIFFGTLFELDADITMKKFKKKRKDSSEVCRNGLWKTTRHPNYFGEIMVWWGIWLVCFLSYRDFYWTLFAPTLMTLMFVFISIPMAERHMMTYKPGYTQYKKEAWMLLPFWWYKRKPTKISNQDPQ